MEVESVNRKWSNEKLFGKESSNIVKLGLNRYDELMRAEISALQHRHSVHRLSVRNVDDLSFMGGVL